MKQIELIISVIALWSCSAAAWAEDTGAGGNLLDNKVLLVTAAAGQPGAAVFFKSDTANKRLELAIQSSVGAQSAPVDKAEVVKNESGKRVLRVTAGNAEADILLGSGGAGYVTINPGKNAASVEVRAFGGGDEAGGAAAGAKAAAGARYVLLPDFFADDVVFDPTKLAMPKLSVPAENFLLQFIEGGNFIVMCIWPGNLNLSQSKSAAAPAKDGTDPQVDLILGGEGKARRISAARIEFQNKPVYVGLLQQKGIWQDEDVSALPAYRPTAIAWKRPFEARWRGDFILAEGKSMSDWPSRNQSFEFQSTSNTRADKWWERGTDAMDARFAAAASNSNPKKWWERGNENNPQIWQESLADFFIYPAVLKGDEVRVCLYADKDERSKAEKATKAARKANKEAPEIVPPNVYERLIVYPIGRVAATPLEIYTPVDLMRETLGAGPCEYVLDLAGVKPRPAGGDRPILSYATCGLWNDHISPIVGKLKKNPDGTFEPLDEKTKAHLIQALEEMWYFVHAVHDRLREYKKWGAEMAEFCKQEEAKGPAAKAVAGKILAKLEPLNNDMSRHKFEGPGSEMYWKDRVPELIKMVNADKYPEIGSIAKIRDLGNDQDERVSRCRQYVKGVLQEILMQDTGDPGVRTFAAEVRDRCHQMLRSMHPKEGF